MKFEDQRRKMVETQIMNRGISDEKVLSAFLKVPRELFVPEKFKHLAYADSPLSIGNGQTISQPYIVALMMELLQLDANDKVLEIGTGSGYQTALLAEICSEIFTIERISILSVNAQKILRELGYENIHFKIGDGSLGWNENLKFNKIIVTAAAPSIPQSLLNELDDNGILVIPTGSKFMQDLIVIKNKNGEFVRNNYGGCTFVPLIGKEGWQM
ncbi:MAG: protein-L-isoaspartate O-methyltransferase [Candidatus Cloacimonas sp. 4484_275]|nr:MAG: protein-L-isoaspartate O-methyltransferase [Candidatus Cloacimonas sp. 4484_275]